MVAGHIIETYSGKHYTAFVEDRIFAPLGMSSSTFSPAKAAKTGKFTQGWTSSGRLLPEWFSEDMVPLMAGAGGVISNAVDMAGTSRLHDFHWPIVFFYIVQSKWVALWLNKGVHDNVPVIPSSVYRNASQSYSMLVGAPVDSEHSIRGYGMGWSQYSYLGHNVTNFRVLTRLITYVRVIDCTTRWRDARISYGGFVPSG